jgi:hypothetical protein
MTRIAVCFFGITRSLSLTISSIERHILQPARKRGRVTVCAHLFQQLDIENPRSGETGRMNLNEHELLLADRLELEPPDLCLEAMGFETLRKYGDAWDDGFHSLRNLLHQLHSLDRVTALAEASDAETVVFVRPDLMYHDSIDYALRSALRTKGPAIWLPNWHRNGGVNDRFSIAHGKAAIAAYGHRKAAAQLFCEKFQCALHSERMLAWRLNQYEIAQEDIDMYASRIRIDGRPAPVDVFPSTLWRFSARWARRCGVKPALKVLLRL